MYCGEGVRSTWCVALQSTTRRSTPSFDRGALFCRVWLSFLERSLVRCQFPCRNCKRWNEEDGIGGFCPSSIPSVLLPPRRGASPPPHTPSRAFFWYSLVVPFSCCCVGLFLGSCLPSLSPHLPRLFFLPTSPRGGGPSWHVCACLLACSVALSMSHWRRKGG